MVKPKATISKQILLFLEVAGPDPDPAQKVQKKVVRVGAAVGPMCFTICLNVQFSLAFLQKTELSLLRKTTFVSFV